MSDDSLHTRVGVFVILALIAAVTLVLTMEGRHLRPGMKVHVQLGRTGSLQVGAKVKISGRTVGSVDGVRFVPRPGGAAATQPMDPTELNGIVMLDVWVDKRYGWMLRENSEFFLNQVGILGEAYLEVGPGRGPDGQPAEPGAALTDGAIVMGVDPPRLDRLAQISYQNLVAVMDLFKNGMPEAKVLARNLSELGDILATLAPDPEATRRLWAARGRLWAEGLALYDEWSAAGVSPEQARATVTKTRALIASAQREIASVRARIDPLQRNIELLQARLDPARFDQFKDILARADALTARAEHILRQVDTLAALVQRGEGTIGAFLADEELQDDFKQMTKELMKQPWKTVGHPQ